MNDAAMNDAATNNPSCSSSAAHAEPVIAAAHLGAGHDGLAEVTIAVRYPNGAERTMSLPYETVEAALDASHITNLDELVGLPWTTLTVDQNQH